VSQTEVLLRHEPAQRRFIAQTTTGSGVLEYDKPDAHTLDYRHTFVPPALRGQGIAGKLTQFALDYAAARHLRVIPSCAFVARFMDTHPQYQRLLATPVAEDAP
jgi:predicted GNAT family acetyltransferase